MLESPWFYEFLNDLLDTGHWGFSLFQFRKESDGWLGYDLIPRKHVEPVRQLILRMQTDIHGTRWDDYDDLLFVGKPRALGDLVKDIPWVLYKRGDVADWSQFAELFGQPIREYTYNAGDDSQRYNLINDIFDSGGLLFFCIRREATSHCMISAARAGHLIFIRDWHSFAIRRSQNTS